MKVLKTIVNTIINILIVLVLIVSVLIAVMALSSKSSGISTVFGYTIQTIQSDSMKGTSPDGYEGGNFEHGDLIIGKATGFSADATYKSGDIVTFSSEDSTGQPMLIVHRIVDSTVSQDGVISYQTWGDNREISQAPDQQSEEDFISADEIAAVFYNEDYHGTVIKGLGNVLDFVQSQLGFFLVVLLPMIIFFLYELIRVVLNATHYKKAKTDDEKQQAVDAAVAAALAQNSAASAASTDAPAMSAEELEQFRQFQAFQKMQQAQQPAPEQAVADVEPAPADEAAPAEEPVPVEESADTTEE